MGEQTFSRERQVGKRSAAHDFGKRFAGFLRAPKFLVGVGFKRNGLCLHPPEAGTRCAREDKCGLGRV